MQNLNDASLWKIYSQQNHAQKKAFLKKVMYDIFQDEWTLVGHSTDEMLDGEFELSFANHFRDPLSQGIVELMECSMHHSTRTQCPELLHERKTLTRFAFYNLSKAWRLRNLFSEATNSVALRAIQGKTTRCSSLLVSRTKVLSTIEQLKRMPLVTPHEKLIQIYSIDNFQMETRSSHTLCANKSKVFIDGFEKEKN